eukprot:NODE_4762_length_753_cov_18.857827_g4739_i0.p1 GENE.NODE_4762_length_753_cov_18.857827_g4739_i0~~NODE_4762_length_753_cov_18.857827_g4739_i0.p1  ORF type:complete len:224 (-),score=27.45 NODE_4762_length_753_cov_18.857827_g4739_i0:82-678(-)
MAPELIRDMAVTKASDVWAFGCTILELLTGERPYAHLGVVPAFTLLYNIGHKGELPRVPGTLAPEAQDFLRKCMAPSSLDRPTAADLLQHPFLNALDKEIVNVPRPPAVGPVDVVGIKSKGPRRTSSHNSSAEITIRPSARMPALPHVNTHSLCISDDPVDSSSESDCSLDDTTPLPSLMTWEAYAYAAYQSPTTPMT